MFDPAPHPRLFGLPPGADFPRLLIDGLRVRLAGTPPEAMGRVLLLVNTRRMERRLRALFDAGPPCLLPRIRLVTDLGFLPETGTVPPALSPLRRRLELAQLVGALLDAEPDLAPRAHVYDLADALAALIDEMDGEGVSPDRITGLDVSDQSGHWARAQKFLSIAMQVVEEDKLTGSEGRTRRRVERLAEHWRDHPPEHPVILAGSTGSRGTTNLLMQAVARLPQGAVVLPGFDFAQPASVWAGLEDALSCEDHPQFRFARLMEALDLAPGDVTPWAQAEVPEARNRLISLALRPAPVTHQWMREGPGLTDIGAALRNVTLIEAPSLRIEALSIALRLRRAVEDGQTAALITPNRMLTRQVEAALDAWGIVADDSAGEPLHLTPQGRFLRHVSALFRERITADTLLTLLKHPLCHSGEERGTHLKWTTRLELHLRRNGPAFPDGPALDLFAAAQKDGDARDWAAWITRWALDRQDPDDRDMPDHVARHLETAEHLAQGSTGAASGALWLRDGGEKALSVMQALETDAAAGGTVSARDYDSVFGSILAGEDVRKPGEPRADVLIWGTLEARVQGADLVILAGLNEGSWPEAPSPDLWLNRKMRADAGLLLPERRIGLSAHDFQQAIAAPEVWLTRATKTEGAETVASRWVNRLRNLLGGLPDHGVPAWDGMVARGAEWLALARRMEDVGEPAPVPRPSPRPPATHRPTELSVTDIEKLIRDPYAIYARKILHLKPLDPLMKAPDARLRGIIAHDVIETFVAGIVQGVHEIAPGILADIAREVLHREVPWTEARLLWHARLARVAPWFCEGEAARQADLAEMRSETWGTAKMTAPEFTLKAKADRVDVDPAGRMRIYDYKTGAAPSAKEQKAFAKQLLLEAAIAERAGFGDLGPHPVAEAAYLQLTTTPKEVPVPLSEVPPAQVWEELVLLIRAYAERAQGYTARAALKRDTHQGDYDLLARYGEWDHTDTPVAEDVE